MKFRLNEVNMGSWLWLLISLITSCVPARALSEDDKALVGIRRVGFTVDVWEQTKTLTGVTESAVKARVEKRLKQAGLVLISESERNKEGGKPDLIISLAPGGLIDDKELEIHFIHAQLVLSEEFRSARRKGLTLWGVTWSERAVAHFYDENIMEERRRVVLGSVDHVVSRFLTAHRKANPKQR